MRALQAAISVTWVVFWVYWIGAAFGAKQSRRDTRQPPFRGLVVLAGIVLVRALRDASLSVHTLALGLVGAVVFASGLALAIWARVHLGRNWGMPTTQKADPELVTSGPYRFVRHPIYTGILLGVLGTALASNLLGLIVVAVLGGYFYYSATVEERNLTATFPTAYPEYRRATKMLVPFLL